MIFKNGDVVSITRSFEVIEVINTTMPIRIELFGDDYCKLKCGDDIIMVRESALKNLISGKKDEIKKEVKKRGKKK